MWYTIALTLIQLLQVYMISCIVWEYLRRDEGMSVEIFSGLQNVLKNCQLIIYMF
jgi:hypothetical protein